MFFLLNSLLLAGASIKRTLDKRELVLERFSGYAVNVLNLSWCTGHNEINIKHHCRYICIKQKCTAGIIVRLPYNALGSFLQNSILKQLFNTITLPIPSFAIIYNCIKNELHKKHNINNVTNKHGILLQSIKYLAIIQVGWKQAVEEFAQCRICVVLIIKGRNLYIFLVQTTNRQAT